MNCTRWVSSCRHTHSAKSSASTSSSRCTCTTLGATSSSRPRRWGPGVKGSYWPSTRPARNPSSAPTWVPLTRLPTAAVAAEGRPLASKALQTAGSSRLRNEPGVAARPARPVDHPHLTERSAGQPAVSATKGTDRAAACRSPATTWAARPAADLRARAGDPGSRTGRQVPVDEQVDPAPSRLPSGAPAPPGRLAARFGGHAPTVRRVTGSRTAPAGRPRSRARPAPRRRGDPVGQHRERQQSALGVHHGARQGAGAGQGARLGPHHPARGARRRRLEPLGQSATGARHRQTGDHRPQLRPGRTAGQLQRPHQQVGREGIPRAQSRPPGEPVARCGQPQGRGAGQHRSARPREGGRSAVVDGDQAGQHLGHGVVALAQGLSQHLGHRGRVDPAHHCGGPRRGGAAIRGVAEARHRSMRWRSRSRGAAGHLAGHGDTLGLEGVDEPGPGRQ